MPPRLTDLFTKKRDFTERFSSDFGGPSKRVGRAAEQLGKPAAKSSLRGGFAAAAADPTNLFATLELQSLL